MNQKGRILRWVLLSDWRSSIVCKEGKCGHPTDAERPPSEIIDSLRGSISSRRGDVLGGVSVVCTRFVLRYRESPEVAILHENSLRTVSVLALLEDAAIRAAPELDQLHGTALRTYPVFCQVWHAGKVVLVQYISTWKRHFKTISGPFHEKRRML